VWLSVLFTGTWWDYTPRLTFPVWEVTVVVDNDVASFSGCLWSNNTFGGDNLSSERGFVFVYIDWYSRLVIVWLGFKEVLLGSKSTPGEWDGISLVFRILGER